MLNSLKEKLKTMNSKKTLLTGFGILLLIFLILSGKVIENVDNSEIVIIQSVFSGKISIYTTPGPVVQNFGRASHYKKSNQFWFSKKTDENNEASRELDQSIKIRFNDGGHGQISGSVRWYMPSDEKAILKLHTDFGSQSAIEQQLIRQVVTKAVYMTGPLMSSKESSAEKRNDLLSYIEDQSINGVYRTKQEDIKVHDDLMNTDKTITVVKIVESNSVPMRQEVSAVKFYNVNLQGLALNAIDYDEEVEKQIKVQQQAYMQVQTAIANSKKAEQDAITTELQGKAAAAKAKWEQEVIKAQAITQAQQEKEVAALEAQTAMLTAQRVKTDADAKSYANSKLVSAGLTPQEKAQFEKDTRIGVAEALSKLVLPSTYLSGNNGNKDASMLESILGMKLLNVDKK
jgi:hypothetical protein